MNVLIDHNLSPRIATALQALFHEEHRVESIKSYFGRTDVPDIEWLETIGKDGGWIVISGDRRITRSPAEKNAFRRSGAIGFFLAPALQSSPVLQQTARLLVVWPTILLTAQTMQPGSMFELPVRSTRLRPIT